MQLVFMEGVSGVGKSTMVRLLSEELTSHGYHVKSHVEFDYTNPIDFYCTACLTPDEYERLCRKYDTPLDAIEAGEAKLVRYYNGDTPLFEEPLLAELAGHEFCYKPECPIPLEEYTRVYTRVWREFAKNVEEDCDFILFDGSLLHHPINDMMRNYHIEGEQALSHVQALLDALGDRKRKIFYLKTGNVAQQLKMAHMARGQDEPTDRQIRFWEDRCRYDRTVLAGLQEEYRIYDVSDNKWDDARAEILSNLERAL